MISDLVCAEPTERMEYFKTLAGKREYVNERTRAVKNSDGTDSLQTFKIVTDHKECYLICCNMGQCFTIGNEEPSSGKEAMIQRTVCLMARKEADDPSSAAAFKANLKKPQVAANIRDFRLFTSLVGYARLAMMGLDWLQPDLAVANLVFKAGDKMLQEEYGMPRPEPRRLVKRTEDLKTVRVSELCPSTLWPSPHHQPPTANRQPPTAVRVPYVSLTCPLHVPYVSRCPLRVPYESKFVCPSYVARYVPYVSLTCPIMFYVSRIRRDIRSTPLGRDP